MPSSAYSTCAASPPRNRWNSSHETLVVQFFFMQARGITLFLLAPHYHWLGSENLPCLFLLSPSLGRTGIISSKKDPYSPSGRAGHSLTYGTVTFWTWTRWFRELLSLSNNCMLLIHSQACMNIMESVVLHLECSEHSIQLQLGL